MIVFFDEVILFFFDCYLGCHVFEKRTETSNISGVEVGRKSDGGRRGGARLNVVRCSDQ